MSDLAPHTARLPPLLRFPERRDDTPHWLDPIEARLTAPIGRLITRHRARRIRALCAAVLAMQERFAALAEDDLAAETVRIRETLRRKGIGDATLPDAFALVREIAARTLGMRPYHTQIEAGLAMLSGHVVEMNTGEGKTLSATLPLSVAALAGIPAHLVTVNDYLAARDAETMQPLYGALGLRVATLQEGMEEPARRAAYRADVVYGSNTEFAFDWLRDRLARGPQRPEAALKARDLLPDGMRTKSPVMRGLHFALVDEADSVLIDEARTPLIIARQSEAEAEKVWAERAHALAEGLREGADFRLTPTENRAELTAEGRKRLEKACLGEDGLWAGRIRREESIRQALAARHFFHAGEHYVLRDGKVVIVDEYTGRVQEDRSWNDGMHQLIESKEGVEVTGRKSPAIRTSYQRFFRRYCRLAGMTGTAREVVGELREVYRLDVYRVRPYRPSRRRILRSRVLRDRAAQLEWIARRVGEMQTAGRPVLIGAKSVKLSDEVSQVLRGTGLDHVVLNAENEAEEAEIVGKAGQAGRITIATNMAGRGTDIGLGPGVADAGGLHVILSDLHDARRIDRQLMGRAARQGDPGTVEMILSPRLGRAAGGRCLRALARIAPLGALKLHQRMAERLHGRMRRDLIRSDRKKLEMLSFSGEAP